MNEIVFSEVDYFSLRSELLRSEAEACAILYASQVVQSDGVTRLLVREIEIPSREDYLRRGPHEAQLRPAFVARTTKYASRSGLAMIFAHTHPGRNVPEFSETDNEGETHLAGFLARRHPAKRHAALVLSYGGLRARGLGTKSEIRVVSLGARRQILADPDPTIAEETTLYDRQVRAFGKAGQIALNELRIGVVGLGGTGSIIVQQLVHLGIHKFLLIDPDVVDESNLNRLANAKFSDIGVPKVEVAERYIRDTAKDAVTLSHQDDVIYEGTARLLIGVDIIFCCTDTHGSRAVVQQVAYQYMIPCIDMGVTIVANGGKVTHLYGRVQLLAPGLACTVCDGLLDSEQVRRDMMTTYERTADPYISGVNEPAPSVMSVNGVVASLAVTMLLSVVCGVPGDARHIIYNGLKPSLRKARAASKAGCYICSKTGCLGRGDDWPLFARHR